MKLKIVFSTLDYLLIFLLVSYLILPIQTPSFLAQGILSPISSICFFIISVTLFLYCNTIVAILYLCCVYELVRRSYEAKDMEINVKSVPNVINQRYQNSKAKKVVPKRNHEAQLQHEPQQITRQIPHNPILPEVEETEPSSSFSNTDNLLEAQIVNKLAPVGMGDTTDKPIVETQFNPIYSKIGNASMF